MPSRILVCLCFVGLCSSPPLQADPVTFDEAISGDLPGRLPASMVFGFTTGVNTVSGVVSFGETGYADFDSFAFSIPAGSALTSVAYSFVTSLSPDLAHGGSDFGLVDGNYQPLLLEDFLARISIAGFAPGSTTATGEAFSSALPLGAGTYGLSHAVLGFYRAPGALPFEGSGFTQHYTWAFTVARAPEPVPEPASLSLLGLSLVGVLARRRMHNARE